MLGLTGVSVSYPRGVIALHPATVAFGRGSFTVLLGPSGAGKSTLLRCLNLLTRPTTGVVTSMEFGILRNGAPLRRHRRQTAMIFQQHQLINRYTALQNVLTGRLGYHSALGSLLPLSRDEQRLALECLDRVGLLHKAETRIDRLSGGERQRVGIARALAQQPATILADEPVASLDPATADKVLSLLKRICSEDGISAVVSLHQVALARTYADRIIGLVGGRMVFDGPPEELDGGQLRLLYHGGAALPVGPASPPEPDREQPTPEYAADFA